MKQIYVFICEDEETSKAIIKEHFSREKITYAEMFDEDRREKITSALALVEG